MMKKYSLIGTFALLFLIQIGASGCEVITAVTDSDTYDVGPTRPRFSRDVPHSILKNEKRGAGSTAAPTLSVCGKESVSPWLLERL
jgi:hypothetical protein